MDFGNPEPEYSKTRHNVGFDVVNYIAKKYNIDINKKEFDSLVGSGMIDGNKVVLMKPQTYMNDSGKAVVQAVNFYKLSIEDVIVIYDDIDIDDGIIKVRKKGGPGTHNGMRSLNECLKDFNFSRVRIGTGKPAFKELLVQHVIGKLKDDEYKRLVPAIEKAGNATIDIIKNGVDIAMNLNNGSNLDV